MRYLILILKDFGYPFLDCMLTDVKLAGIGIVTLLAAGGELLTSEGNSRADTDFNEILPEGKEADSYVVTDCDEGVRFARKYNTGYVFKEEIPDASDEDLAVADVWDAQCIIQSFEVIGADFIVKMYERFHHLPWTILETKRLILREMTVDDVDRLYEIYSEPGITDYTEPLYEDRQQEIEYTRDYIKNMYEFCGYGLWLVIEKESVADSEGIKGAGVLKGRVVGRAGITGREGYEEAELGYVIEKSRQKRGYATEACRAVMDYARDVLKMKGLNCFVQPGNEASAKLCKLLGFEYLENTVLSDIEMYRYHKEL